MKPRGRGTSRQSDQYLSTARSSVTSRSSAMSRDGSNASVRYLRKRAHKKKLEQEMFADELVEEKDEYNQMVVVRMEDASEVARALHLDREYKPVWEEDEQLGTRNLVVSVHCPSEPEAEPTKMSLDMFLREHTKLKNHLARQTEFAQTMQSTAGGPDSNSAGSSMGRSGGGGKLAQSLSASQKAHRTGKLTRAETRAEMQDVLESTQRLTAVLEEQLATLKKRGWNQHVLRVSNPGHL
jgi:hypothetical protein